MTNLLKNIFPKSDKPGRSIHLDTSTDLKKKNEQLKQEIERLNAVNADLQKLADASPVKEQAAVATNEMLKLSFEYENVKYGFAFTTATYKGKKITAEDVVADKQLQAELITKRSGMINKL
jgi:hypothetical protein